MSFKAEFKRDMRNLMKDVEKEVHKTWTVDFKGHRIEIINEMKEELLIIDGETVDRNRRKSVFSHIIPYSKLSGSLHLEDGTNHIVSVKLGGYTSLNCIVKIDNKTVIAESHHLDFLPWDNKERIVSYIGQQVQTHNKIVDNSLPDDEYVYDENHPQMAAGLSDQFSDDIPTPFYVKKLLKLFKEQLNNPTSKTRKATYEKIIDETFSSYREEFIEGFQQVQLDETLVHQEALWLLEHAAHREVVKFSITVLGCTDCEKHKGLLYTLGMHEEFTSYVIFALKNGTVGANNQIWRLAQVLHGWGKITAVEQLDATKPEIKQWLLTKGCENAIMNEYLAYTCALKGDLEGALEEDVISKELYNGAGLIIQALLNEESPAQGVEDYPYASTAFSRFVHHARTHCKTIEDFYPIMKISEYINADKEEWEERFNDQWKEYQRTFIQEAIQPIITNPNWSQLAVDALQKGYHFKALEIARYYEIDITANLFELLENNPTKSELYYAVMGLNNRKSVAELCAFAEKHLSLSDLSIDEQYCLQCIVQDLHTYEGVGLALIQAALESDNVSLQYHALSVLEEWPSSTWKDPAILIVIKNIATKSKDKEDRKLAKLLLSK